MFNNNTYTDFRKANERILISSCYSSDLTEPEVTKLNSIKGDKENKLVKRSLIFSIFI